MLLRTLEAAFSATTSSLTIDILINGNPRLVKDVANWKAARLGQKFQNQLRVWSIVAGDKANAWNQYFHRIWDGEELAFFSDGYVRIQADSIRMLAEAVLSNVAALGGSGVPSVGRSAKRLAQEAIRNGAFHGGLCCIRGEVIAEIKRRNFRIPLGLYRTDSLVGAILSFGLDSQRNEWDARRIVVHPLATWNTTEKHWWNPQDVIATLKRFRRQARGLLENAAIKDHLAVQRFSAESLPRTVQALVRNWRTQRPAEARRLFWMNPMTRIAYVDATRPRDWHDAELEPTLILDIHSRPELTVR